MKIAIIGAGFTGLSAGLELVRHGQDVTMFEASDRVGGLAVGFQKKGWEWSVERFYHHIFENDEEIIALSRSVGTEPLFFRPISTVFWKGRIYPFDSPQSLFTFPGLTFIEKMRMGLVVAMLKTIPDGTFLERWTTVKGLTALMGEHGYQTIWEPLLVGKFGKEADRVNLAWFWARIKKRTPRLGTFPGGFQALADRIAQTIVEHGGKIRLGEKTSAKNSQNEFDVVLSTLPFSTNYQLPASTRFDARRAQRGEPATSYLDAHVLLLELKRPFLRGTYWINVLDRTFPFLVTAEHTNFVDPKYFGNSHLLYIGNYLPGDHRLFSLSNEKVFEEFFPWLQKINPQLRKQDVASYEVFKGPFAQPIVTVNYSKTIPPIKRTNKLFVANQSMIYPWDRGTNYAVKLGKEAAKIIINDL